MAVDDPRRRRQERSQAGHLGLELADLRTRELDEIGHAVRPGVGLELREDRDLRLGSGDDELAGPGVGDAVLRAIGVERPLSLHAQASLQRAGRIVDAGVNHLRVARACVKPDGPFGLEHHHFPSGKRESPRHSQPDDPCADDRDV